MFYCEECRRSNGWPEGDEKAIRPCEICDKVAPCHDVPTRRLVQWPPTDPHEDQKKGDGKEGG